jgi:precorrin-6B methylase 1
MENYNLKGTVHFPTRTTATTSSMLDNIFIDKSSNFIIKSYISGLSDHDAQLITLNDEILPKQISKTITTRTFNNINNATFLNYLSYENWRDVFTENNSNSMFNNFLELSIIVSPSIGSI